MFLFNKKTRNIIKYIWIILSILIVLSMIIAYSGFSTLAVTQPTQQTQEMEIPAEVREQLQMQQEGGAPVDLDSGADSYEKQQVLKAIEEGRININPEDGGEGQAPTEGVPEAQPSTPPAQELKLEI